MKIVEIIDTFTLRIYGAEFGILPPVFKIRIIRLKTGIDLCNSRYDYFYQAIETIVIHSTYSAIENKQCS